MSLGPCFSLAEVYGPDVIYVIRSSWRQYDMLRRGDESIRDGFTGVLLPIVGTGTPLCSAGTYRPEGLELLREAGIAVPDQPILYRGSDEYNSALSGLVEAGTTLAFQHVHPPDEVPAHGYWIHPALLSLLNDKANLTRFVPAEYCPPRRLLPIETAATLPLEPGETLVIKGSTPRSTGAGGAVVMARTTEQLRSLPSRLDGCSHVVVEEFQPFVRTMCVTWAATTTGEIHYVGSADQVVDGEGCFHGSWIGPSLDAPEAAVRVGRAIMTSAVELGYVGFAGFDMGILPDGAVLVFDLNFRLCSSTPALLCRPLLDQRHPEGYLTRLANFRSVHSFREMCRLALEAVSQGILFPLSSFDPLQAGWQDRAPSLRGMVVGRDRAETEARCEALARAGLEFK